MKKTAFAALALLLALGGTANAAEILRIGIGPEPETLDPHRGLTLGAGRVLLELCEGLLTRDASGRTVPGVAERWEQSADGLVWTFHLRPDARWWNGDRLTADDFVRGWRRAVDPATASGIADLLDGVENATAIRRGQLPPEQLGIRALDRDRVQVRLARPLADFDMVLAHRITLPVHGPTLARVGDGFTAADQLVCNGPYRLAGHRLHSAYQLVRNDFYHRPALTAAVELVVSDGPEMELNLFRTGTLHATSTLPGAMVGWARQEMPESLHIHPWTLLTYLRASPNGPWRDNPAFVEALALALNRDQLTAPAQGRAIPAYGLVPPGLWRADGNNAPPATPAHTTGQQAARDALARAGYGPAKPPPKVEILHAATEPVRQRVVAIAAQWKQVLGVETELVGQESRIVAQRDASGDFNGFVLNAWISYAPSYALATFLPPGTAMPAAEEGLKRLERQILDSGQIIPISFGSSQRLVSPALRGWQDNVYDIHPASRLSLATD
jgi:oligopeptide transport system substrate-binding protein